MTKLGLVLALAAVLVGCQGNSRTPPAASYDAGVTGAATPFDPLTQHYEVRRLMLEYLVAINRACYRPDPAAPDGVVIGSSLSARDECMMRQIRGSLGMMDASEAACQQTVIVDVLRCALIGSAATRVIAAAGSNTDEVMNWSDPDASLALGSRLLATRAALNCGQGVQISCVTRQMGAALLLPAAAVDSCAQQMTDTLQIRCVGAEFVLDQMRSALLYVT